MQRIHTSRETWTINNDCPRLGVQIELHYVLESAACAWADLHDATTYCASSIYNRERLPAPPPPPTLMWMELVQQQ